MLLANLAASPYDEVTLGVDTTAPSDALGVSLLVSYGTLGAGDTADFYMTGALLGTYKIVVTTDPWNGSGDGWGLANTDFSLEPFDSQGNLLHWTEETPDAYTHVISFFAPEGTVFYAKVSTESAATVHYAMKLIAEGPTFPSPILLSASPADAAGQVDVNSAVTFTFYESIQRGTGTILLVDADGNTVESFDVATDPHVQFGVNTLTVTPSSPLHEDTPYHIVLPEGSVLGRFSFATDPFPGLDSYTFTTRGFDQVVTGSPGADTISGSTGNDSIDGGAGVDTVVYAQPHANYSIQHTGSTITVTGPEGSDLLTNLRRAKAARRCWCTSPNRRRTRRRCWGVFRRGWSIHLDLS